MNKKKLIVFISIIVCYLVILLVNISSSKYEGTYIFNKKEDIIFLDENGVFKRELIRGGKKIKVSGRWWEGKKSHIWFDQNLADTDSIVKGQCGYIILRDGLGNISGIKVNEDLNMVYYKK